MTPPICRFCLEPSQGPGNPLITPCPCKGSVRYVHTICLARWMMIDPSEKKKACSICLCKFDLNALPVEVIPPTGSLIDFFLHSSISLFFLIQYTWLFLLTTVVIYKEEPLSDYVLQTQVVLHALFGSMFFSRVKIKRMEAYWRLSQKRYAALLAVHAILVSLVANGSFLTTFTLGVYLSIYWKLHVAVLQESNDELLARLRADLL